VDNTKINLEGTVSGCEIDSTHSGYWGLWSALLNSTMNIQVTLQADVFSVCIVENRKYRVVC
jgi:hypothetical protein